jgi:phosphate transport system substrate-binding protein
MKSRLATASLLLMLLVTACKAADPPVQPAACEAPRRPAGLVLGGTGAGLAMLNRLADAARAEQPGAAISVLPSLGTAGGLRALREGQLDLAIISRDLNAEERAAGLIATQFARAPIAFATRRPARARSLTTQRLTGWYSEPGARWPDRSRVTMLFRESGDGGLKVIKAADAALGEALDHDPRLSGQGVLLQTDQQMRDALLDIPGALGWIDLGTILLEDLPLQPLVIDGVAPTPENLATNRYPFAISLWLVRRADAPPAVERLITFASSPAMRAVWASHGYVLAAGGS